MPRRLMSRWGICLFSPDTAVYLDRRDVRDIRKIVCRNAIFFLVRVVGSNFEKELQKKRRRQLSNKLRFSGRQLNKANFVIFAIKRDKEH